MKVYELSKELKEKGFEVTNKDLIAFLKDNGNKISSHMQEVPDEMIEPTVEYFSKPIVKKVDIEDLEELEEFKSETPEKKGISYVPKKFELTDMIPCRSVTPWKLVEVGADRRTTYSWNGYGDVDYVSYKDLQAMRRKKIIKKTKIVIEDPDICYQWRNDLGNTYKYFLNVEFPEEFFDLPDEKFKRLLKTAPDTIKDVIKFTAMNMVRNENYPTVQKLMIVDEVLGTCIKDFL